MQTRVGYGGGLSRLPSYRNIGGHAECLRVVYDPTSTSYAELLDAYQRRHRPRRRGGQYRSVLFPLNAEEEALVKTYTESLGDDTEGHPEVIGGSDPRTHFWNAEDYHQKHRLRRDQELTQRLRHNFGEDWDQHTIATKLNASLSETQRSAWLTCLTTLEGA